MAEGGVKVWLFSAGGIGCIQALNKAVPSHAWITSFDDGLLRFAADHLGAEEYEYELFGNVVARFLNMCGGIPGSLANNSQVVAILENHLQQLPEDGVFFQSARYPGCAPLVWEAIQDLGRFGWSSYKLAEASENLPGSQGVKLRELAELWTKLDSTLAEHNRLTLFERIRRLLVTEPLERIFPVKDLVVLYGKEEKPAYDQVLEWISQNGVRIHLLLENPDPANHLFPLAKTIEHKMRAPVVTQVGHRGWTSSLFAPETKGVLPDLEVWRAPDPLSECEWVLRDCIPQVTEGRKVGLFARSAETYAPLLYSAADRLGVGLNVSLNQPLLTNGLARTVNLILETLAQSDVRRINRLAGSSYLRCTRAQKATLREALTDAYRQKGAAWDHLARFAEASADDLPWLSVILEWRAYALAHNLPLHEWTNQVETLVGETRILDATVQAEDRIRRRDQNASTVLLRSLRARVLIGQAQTIPFRDFVQTAKAIWENETYTDTAPAKNGVSFVNDTSRLGAFDSIYILGLLEGDFPRRRKEHPILGDLDLALLNDTGLALAPLPDSHAKALTEREEFVRICGSGREKLVFTYPESDDDSDSVPAFYLKEIQRLADQEERVIRRSLIVPAPAECVSPADLVLAEAFALPKTYGDEIEITLDLTKRLVMPSEEGVDFREIPAILTCPFRSAFQHRMAVHPPFDQLGEAIFTSAMNDSHLWRWSEVSELESAIRQSLTKRLEATGGDLQPWQEELVLSTIERFVREWTERELQGRAAFGQQEMIPLGPQELPNENFRGVVKAAGISQPVYGKLPNLSLVDGVPTLNLFRSSTQSKEENDSDELRLLVRLLAVLMRKAAAQIVVDSPRGPRVIYNTKNTGFKAKTKGGVMLRGLGHSVADIWQRIQPTTIEALQLLSQGTVRPRPGEACDTCSLGELCRRHLAFGESESPFDRGGS